jgi:hypothetical protein
MKKILFFFLHLIIVSSCQTDVCPGNPDSLNENFQSFVEEIKSADRFYSSNQWEELDKEFLLYTKDCYNSLKPEFTDDQKKFFWSYGIQYFVIKDRKNATKILLDPEISFAAHVRENILETWKTPDEAFTEIFTQVTGQKFDSLLQKVRTEYGDSTKLAE